MNMFLNISKRASALALGAVLMMSASVAGASDDGVIRVKSAFPMAETITRLKQDVAAKGIRFFQEIDQSQLAADAGVQVLPSTLLVFGNPPLGTQFLKANPEAGLDWPVRLLVHQDQDGNVWAVYTDFAWIAKRHSVSGDAAQPFRMASEVIASITSSVKTK
jgi:uncharacterized protein (DUF302 family)